METFTGHSAKTQLSKLIARAEAGEEIVIAKGATPVWEFTTKARLGKLPGALEVAADVAGCLRSQLFTPLDITLDHAQRAGSLPGARRDPFDRLLIAQAQAENLPLVSPEAVFDGYGVVRIW